MRVVMTVLDSLPARHVDPQCTPALHALAVAGGWRREGGRAVMTSATYPNHATFATGTGPDQHGIVANWVPINSSVPRDRAVRPAWELGPAVPTLFDACRAAGRSSIAVVGDQNLVGVMGALAADEHWPPDGVVPAGTRTDVIGYIDDRDTALVLFAALDRKPDLLVAQINGADTAAHVHGPDADGAIDAYRSVDAIVGEVRVRLAPDWDDIVWIIVSDHDQETVTVGEPIDLQTQARTRGLDVWVIPEGNAALVCGPDLLDGDWLAEVDGLQGSVSSADAVRTTWCVPGGCFGREGDPVPRGTHGGPRTRAQVAVVAGGHPAVEAIAGALDRGRVHAADWGTTIADLLALELPTTTGRSLAR